MTFFTQQYNEDMASEEVLGPGCPYVWLYDPQVFPQQTLPGPDAQVYMATRKDRRNVPTDDQQQKWENKAIFPLQKATHI